MKYKLVAGLSVMLFALAAISSVGAAGASTHDSVYTISNSASNSVLQFQAAASNGALTLVGTFPTQGSGTGAKLTSQGALALTADDHWLVVVNAKSNQITSFQVNDDGSLTFESVVASQGTTPISVTIDGHLVYVLNNGTSTIPGSIAGFRLGNDGQLTFIPGSVQPLSGKANTSPEQIGFSSDGNVLVVTEKAAGMIDTYTVGAGGLESAPIVTPSNSAGPYGFAFTPQGYLVLSEAAAGTLSSYAVSDSGSLRTLSGSIPDFGLAPCWVAVSPNGEFAFTSNAHGGTISGYSVSESGMLSLYSSVAARVSIPALDLAFGGNHHSQFLYVLNGGSITDLQVYADGSVAQVASVGALPPGTTGLVAS